MSPGDLLAGRYELRSPIGRGASGEVWQARDTALQRDVAVKVVSLAGADDAETARFQQEARTAASLNHPHVVGVYDAGTDGDHAFLVMELLPGPTLATLVREGGPLAPERAADLAAQAAAGLEAAHRVGVLHRDVKPGNLVLDARGRVRLVDFGIARLTEATGTRLTATGMVVGSASYLSPEQARGDTATPASDHYALGCTLMTLLTGEPPFTAEHPMAVLRQHLDEAPPRVSDRRDGVPAWLDAAVDDLLAKDPVRRAAGVAALQRGGPPSTGATAVLPDAAPSPSTTAVLPPPPPPPPTTRRRLPVGMLAAAALAAIVVLVVLIAVLAQDGDAPPPDASASTSERSTPATPTPTTDDPGTAPPATTDGAAEPSNLAAAVAALRDVVAQEAGSGGLEGKTADDLTKRVEDLQKALEDDKPDKPGKPGKGGKGGDDEDDALAEPLDEITRKLAEGQEKGEVSASAADRISSAVDGVRAFL